MAGEMTLRELETLARKAGIRHEVAARAIVLRIAEWLDGEAQREALRDAPFQALGFVALFRRASELRAMADQGAPK
jgi:hypothetical protein